MNENVSEIIRKLPITRIKVAIYLGISRTTLWEKMERESFTEEEVKKIYELKKKYNK